jgi:hypothetical protein
MVTTYNEKGGEFYTMTSKRAHYLGNGEIKFKGKVVLSVWLINR